MKRMLSLVAALALTLLVVPAMAADTSNVGDTSNGGERQGTFYALSKVPTTESTAPTQMTDDQLAAVEAGDPVNVCVVCANVGVNACVISGTCGNQNNNQSNNPR